jgi:hypothetical protein
MTGTDLCVNKPHCAAIGNYGLKKSVPVIFEPPCISYLTVFRQKTYGSG